MKKKLFKSDGKPQSLLSFDKRAALAIQNHFRLSDYQIVIISWLKGLWTGVLLSLVLHHFFSH